MDLFFDNPVVALTNGIARALSARNVVESQRQLDRLYEIRADSLRPGRDTIVWSELSLAWAIAIDDARQELAFLQGQ